MNLIKTFIEKKIGIESILNSFSEALIIIDKNEQVLYANEAGKQVVEKMANSPSQKWGENLGIYQVNQRTPLTHQEYPLIRALHGMQMKDVKLFIKNVGEQGFFMSVDAVPLKDEEGSIIAAMAIYRDITNSILRERKLIEERVFYQKLVDFIPARILVKDLQGNYIFTNKMVEDDFPGMTGKTVHDIFPADAAKLMQESDQDILKNKKEIIQRFELPFPDGTVHHLLIIRFPLLDNYGTITGICVLAFDETEKIEQEKRMATERIKSINASKLAALGTMAAEIGHEINNPLSIINTSLVILRDMLANNEDPEEMKLQIDLLERTTKRITDIVAALRNVSRDSTHEKKSNCTIFDILNDVQSLSHTRFKLKGVDLLIDDSEVDVSMKIPCLRVQISQVLLNILGNAIDALEGIKNPAVKIKLQQDEGFVYFKICDNGPGVPEEVRERLFEPFFTTKDIGVGTGLGLSIAKEIMHRQQGDIYLDLEQGPSCFSVKLPKRDLQSNY